MSNELTPTQSGICITDVRRRSASVKNELAKTFGSKGILAKLSMIEKIAAETSKTRILTRKTPGCIYHPLFDTYKTDAE